MAPTSEQITTFLTQECDRMLALYSQEQANTQSVFNFYLTFVSALLGAVIVLLQNGATELLVVVLFFGNLVGTVYIGSISVRYARTARYSYAVDAIRRHLIQTLEVPVPPLYDDLIQVPTAKTGIRPHYWLFPTGTFQMFMAFMSSAGLGVMTLLVFWLAGSDLNRALVAAIIIFFLTLTIFNIYSRLVIERFSGGVRVHRWRESPAWASRE